MLSMIKKQLLDPEQSKNTTVNALTEKSVKIDETIDSEQKKLTRKSTKQIPETPKVDVLKEKQAIKERIKRLD